MKKLICISLSLLLVLSLFSGCAAEKASMDYAYTSAAPLEDGLYDGELFYRNENFEMSTEAPMDTAEPQSVADNRKLIRTLSLQAETEAYDEFLVWVETQVRCDALNTEYTRLLELLEQAKSLNEILEIENRLTEVRYELQRIESQLRTYDNLVDYATITLNISEVEVYTPVVVEEVGFWADLGEGFVESLEGTWEVIKTVFRFVVLALPYLLLAAIVPATVFLVLHFRNKKKR